MGTIATGRAASALRRSGRGAEWLLLAFVAQLVAPTASADSGFAAALRAAPPRAQADAADDPCAPAPAEAGPATARQRLVFMAAYALRSARCHDSRGRYEQALKAYQDYAAAKAVDPVALAWVQARIRALQARPGPAVASALPPVGEAPVAATRDATPSEKQAVSTPLTPPTPMTPDQRRIRLRTWGGGLVLVGALAAIAGGALSWQSDRLYQEIHSCRCRGEEIATGQLMDQAGIGLLLASAVPVATGITLLGLSRRAGAESRPGASLAPTLRPSLSLGAHGLTLGFGGDF